jgi:oxygen-independent coproporphyrinogen-3 oxidase
MTTLAQLLEGSPFQGYAYAYPHKTAYRRLPRPLPLRDVWAPEDRRALFLYLHVPFCEMRCGFCNLFTQARPKDGLPARYLAALRCEANQVREALGEASFAQLAIGGGTPTFLTIDELEELFALVRRLGVGRVPASVETSPTTAERDKLELLKAEGVTRISLGVQSFVEAENAASARPQCNGDVENALATIRAVGFATLNIDLIYGLPHQTLESWLHSVERALEFSPEELYLYPLYVRPLTSLGKSRRHWDDLRLDCLRQARALLQEKGYSQISMRMFKKPSPSMSEAIAESIAAAYRCQDDGMVGLGCGARSYTRGLHYSREYAVASPGVREILADYLQRDEISFAHADYGFALDGDEQRRRYVAQSLLQSDGLDAEAYRLRFGSDLFADLPQLAELQSLGLAQRDGDRLTLTPRGMEASDVIGPWLNSPAVDAAMRAYEQR